MVRQPFLPIPPFLPILLILPVRPYSYRSASIASTAVARRAGT